MKKNFILLLSVFFVFILSGCANSSKMDNAKQEITKSIKNGPKNIDKNNVAITENEEADQTDPTLIEGNLEKNDFKN